jgi:hypothetical protein
MKLRYVKGTTDSYPKFIWNDLYFAVIFSEDFKTQRMRWNGESSNIKLVQFVVNLNLV